jgi:sporulation protein YlmC with PRC-barrel domain
MNYSVKNLKGYAIGATDGDIGKVDDLYFDDDCWTIRYLVAETARWLLNRKVLISPFALGEVDVSGERLKVTLTKKQVEESPGIDTDKPVSRKHEASYFDYYGYPYYWGGGYLGGGAMAYPRLPPQLSAAALRRNEKAQEKREAAYDSHLRSANKVTGYHIEAIDGDIGHIEDFIIDEKTWEIRYMVVDTQNWWPGRKVLVAPPWIGRVSWDESKVYVDLLQETIKNGPEYHPEALDRTYEEMLYNYYKRPKYWAL